MEEEAFSFESSSLMNLKFIEEIHSEVENFNFALNLMKCGIFLQEKILSNLNFKNQIFLG